MDSYPINLGNLMTRVGRIWQDTGRHLVIMGDERENKRRMTTTSTEATEVVCYPAPGGYSDFHQVAGQLHQDHPRNTEVGRWASKFLGDSFEFRWINA